MSLEPIGIPRLKESLETNDWDYGDMGDIGTSNFNPEKEDFFESFAAEEAEMGVEILGMKATINTPDTFNGGSEGIKEDEEALQVEELEQMMRKMQAVKGTGRFPQVYVKPR